MKILKPLATVTVVCLAIAGAVVLGVAAFRDGPPQDIGNGLTHKENAFLGQCLENISPGSTKSEVFSLLGKPSTKVGEKASWLDILEDGTGRVEITFDSEGTVSDFTFQASKCVCSYKFSNKETSNKVGLAQPVAPVSSP